MTHPTMLAWSFGDLFPIPWLQIPGLVILIGLIVFWVIYRRRQL